MCEALATVSACVVSSPWELGGRYKHEPLWWMPSALRAFLKAPWE